MRCVGRQLELTSEAVAALDLLRSRLGLEVVHHRGVAHDRVHRPAQDPLEDLCVRVRDGHDRVGRTGQAALVASQQLLPGTGQAGHAASLAVDVVGVVDDDSAEVLSQCHRLAERDDALGLPHVETLDLSGDDLGPGAGHAQVAERLSTAADAIAQPSPHTTGAPARVVAGLGQAGGGQPAQHLRLADASDGVVVELLGGGQARPPARDDRDVVAG